MSQNNLPACSPILYAGLDVHQATLQLHLAGRDHVLANDPSAATAGSCACSARPLQRGGGAACRSSAKHQRLRAPGKPVEVALTAVMRKLGCLLNLALKNPYFTLAS